MDRSPRTQNPTAPYAYWYQGAPSARCEVCGRQLAPTGSDWAGQANQWYANTYAPLMNNVNQMWSNLAQTWAAPATNPYAPLMDSWTRMWSGMAAPWATPGTVPAQPGSQTHPHHPHQHHHHHEDCGCEEGDCDGCHGDQCHCRCCITDADLVVYARVGERRLVPLTIENPRRRERQIKLDLSNWSSHGGTAGNVKARILGGTEFTLAACHEHEAILEIEATVPTANKIINEHGTAAEAVSAEVRQLELELRDVDDCQVFYADLRVEGCEMRPVRIALALLPRDCAGFKVDCGCSCC